MNNEIWCGENFGLFSGDMFYLLSAQLWADCGKGWQEGIVKDEGEPFENIEAWQEVQDEETTWMSSGKLSYP